LVTKNNHFRGKKKHSFYFKQENLNKLLKSMFKIKVLGKYMQSGRVKKSFSE